MVSDAEAGALHPLGLVDQHVAALVVSVVGDHHAGGHRALLAVEGLDQLGRLRAGRRAHVQHLRAMEGRVGSVSDSGSQRGLSRPLCYCLAGLGFDGRRRATATGSLSLGSGTMWPG